MQKDSLPAETVKPLNVDSAVRERYSAASQQVQPALCCPVSYDGQYLDVLPRELIERDYGCGDPSQHVQRGETVLDLGSGAGKLCYIASQIVGPDGRVIGVDVNDDMLALARRFQSQVGDRIGWHNVQFRKGRIQDLGLDLDSFDAWLRANPLQGAEGWLRAEEEALRLRREQPLIASNSIDVVLSNCVLNLVRPEDRRQLFAEIFRVLRRGGRAVISDIVSDEEVPEALQRDAELWSGCISGAFEESGLLREFEQAGFYGISILQRQSEPWAVVEGIEFRSITVQAYKGKDGPCLDHHQAVIYRGPWRSVTDDDGHVLHRGQRMAVCQKTFEIYTSPPYKDQIVPVPPYEPVSEDAAQTFECLGSPQRPPRVTKGNRHASRAGTLLPGSDCCGSSGCC